MGRADCFKIELIFLFSKICFKIADVHPPPFTFATNIQKFKVFFLGGGWVVKTT